MTNNKITLKIYHDDVCFFCTFSYAFARHRMIYKDRVNTFCCFLSAFYSTFSSNDVFPSQNQSLSIFYDVYPVNDFVVSRYIFYYLFYRPLNRMSVVSCLDSFVALYRLVCFYLYLCRVLVTHFSYHDCEMLMVGMIGEFLGVILIDFFFLSCHPTF